MKSDRHKEILSYLSFMRPGTPLTDDKLRKLRELDDWLKKNCQLAWDIEPHATIDESRLRMYSRFCSFVWTMLCKPIKQVALNNSSCTHILVISSHHHLITSSSDHRLTTILSSSHHHLIIVIHHTHQGLTIYCLNFARTCYLFNWIWFTGAGRFERPQGQPTDTSVLDEGNEESTGYIFPLCMQLVTSAFNQTCATIYTDKAFTSIKLGRALAARGVALIGMMRGGRPKDLKNGAEHHWPMRSYQKAEAEAYPRGFARRAYTELPTAHGRRWWMCAETWLDSRFVTLLSTAYHSKTMQTVQRWTKALGARVSLSCSLPLSRYCKMLGGVDRFNKQLVATHMGMGRCQQRYHRTMFLGWLLPAVGVVNVRIVFNALWPYAIDGSLQNRRGVKGIGYPKWQQVRNSTRRHLRAPQRRVSATNLPNLELTATALTSAQPFIRDCAVASGRGSDQEVRKD